MADSLEVQAKKSLSPITLAMYWRHAKTYWRFLVLCAIGMSAVLACDLAVPLVYKSLFDALDLSALRNGDPKAWSAVAHQMFLIACAMAGSWLSWVMLIYGVNNFEARAMKDVADESYEYLQGHSYSFFNNNFSGALVKRINRFAAGFEVIGDQCTFQLGMISLRAIWIIGILFYHNAWIGWLMLAWSVGVVALNMKFSNWKLKYDLHRAKLDTHVTAILSDTIANSVNLKLFAGTKREIAGFKDATEKLMHARYKSWQLHFMLSNALGLLTRALELGSLWLAIKFLPSGAVTIGELFMLLTYQRQLAHSVNDTGNSVRRIYESLADANEMTEVMTAPHEVVDAPNAKPITIRHGRIEFRDVWFSYNDRDKIMLEGFGLTIEPGEKVGIVGPTGSGKSTVLKLLLRLYDVTSGKILVDGQDISRATQDSLHRQIAYVPQDPILFHRTLMENIRYSRPEASDEEVIRAAKLAHCDEFITAFPDGYETLVGERGVKLSGGERQRVAIARAILMDARIILLDEATSSLDYESEEFVQDALARLVAGRTVITVAHRLSTVRDNDRIMVVKDGQITEQGSHFELLNQKGGHYRKLWKLQSKGSAAIAANTGEGNSYIQ